MASGNSERRSIRSSVPVARIKSSSKIKQRSNFDDDWIDNPSEKSSSAQAYYDFDRTDSYSGPDRRRRRFERDCDSNEDTSRPSHLNRHRAKLRELNSGLQPLGSDRGYRKSTPRTVDAFPGQSSQKSANPKPELKKSFNPPPTREFNKPFSQARSFEQAKTNRDFVSSSKLEERKAGKKPIPQARSFEQAKTSHNFVSSSKLEERKEPGKHRGRNTHQSPHEASQSAKGADKDKSWFDSVQSLSPRDIMTLSKQSPDKIVNELFSKIKAFQGTLQRNPLLDKPNIMDAIIIILSKTGTMLSSDTNKASQILAEVMSERCAVFQMRLKRYIQQDLCQVTNFTSGYHSYTATAEEKTQKISSLFHQLMVCLPGSSWSCLPIDEFQKVVEELISNGTIIDQGYACQCNEILTLRDNAREQHARQNKQSKHEEGGWDNSEYKLVQILPEWKEVCVRQKPPRLRKNIISGSYSDWLHYYDVQFRLLREDFVAPLRNGVCDYLDGTRGRRLKNVRVYQNVLIKEPSFSETGLCYKIELDFSHMRRRCNWGHSKRLLHGSLLCLSPDYDNFHQEIYFATVTNRDASKLENGELEVMFQGDVEILSFSCKETPFIMVESCAYYEASRHILRSLQTAEVDTKPNTFTNYLITGDCSSVAQPQYLERFNDSYNLSFLLTEEEKKLIAENKIAASSATFSFRFLPPKIVDVDQCFLVQQLTSFDKWPSCDQTELDNSQMKGLQMALTQEIAVIQGPPGTGKTYIGLKIVEALLHNKDVWNTDGGRSPILVMCFTNHALDQFLEGILNSPMYKEVEMDDINVVRIGGRSQSEKLAELNLSNKRRNVFLPGNIRHEKFQAEDDVRDFLDANSVQKYYDTMRNCKHVCLKDLLEHGVIDPAYHSQLFHFVRSEEQQWLAMEIWLLFYSFNHPYLIEKHHQLVQQKESEQNQPASDNKHSEPCQTESEQDESDNESLIEITGEAAIEQSGRLLLDDISQSPVKQIVFSQNSMDYKEYTTSLKRHHHSFIPSETDEDGFHNLQQNRIPFDESWAKKILELGFSLQAMSEEEYSNVSNIFALSFEDRWRLYHYWRLQYLRSLCEKCEHEFTDYNKLCMKREEARKNADRYALETAEIIGMTTTGAAKYQHILHQVKPRIVIVEEAAEVLESHIVSALNAGTQHLILIGDHKQLRPKPNEYELAKKYNLDVSLFERLVRNGFPHATLEYQHRMRPEIAELVKPHIYTTLSNHSSVEDYPNVRGVSTNLFFINHTSEEKEDEHLVSHSNPHEAAYLVSLCRYLLQQRYTPQQITILVTYAGQLLAMRKLMPRIEFEGVRVSTVDNFQGEENDIILLSLVRSNGEMNVGFLREENRVCVALSRARQGFYCIGNFTMLRNQVLIWETIMSDMEAKGKLGESLTLHCSNHSHNKFAARTSQDFKKHSPSGGCLLDCTFRLKCGHVCALKCHYTDPEHTSYICRKSCPKSCPEGHPCQNLCFKPCQCKVRVTRKMPDCDHDQEMYCYEKPCEVNCTNSCKKQCRKGLHVCPLKCHEKCKPCDVLVSVIMPHCKHPQLIKCHKDPQSFLCRAACSHVCENGHPCPKLCYEECGKCEERVIKTIPECNHKVSLPCHVKPEHKECTEPCERLLPCNHKCSLKCGKDCLSEECSKMVTVELPDCKHKMKVECYRSQDLSEVSCSKPCERALPCGHPCKQECSQPCQTQCTVKVNKVWPCGHKLKRPCYQTLNPEEYPCNAKCDKKLNCGHSCSKTCKEPCDEKCLIKVNKQYPCGHVNDVSCSSNPSEVPCKFLCAHILACGHKCAGKCAQCTARHIHEPVASGWE